MKKIEEYVRSIPDFPEKGIIFRDITSVLGDADGLKLAIDSMIGLLDGLEFDVIAGTESRGFIFGVPIAYALGKPFVPILVDDLIATGGTIEACIRLVEELGGEVAKIIFLMELAGLKGRDKLSGYDVASIITYEGN